MSGHSDVVVADTAWTGGHGSEEHAGTAVSADNDDAAAATRAEDGGGPNDMGRAARVTSGDDGPNDMGRATRVTDDVDGTNESGRARDADTSGTDGNERWV